MTQLSLIPLDDVATGTLEKMPAQQSELEYARAQAAHCEEQARLHGDPETYWDIQYHELSKLMWSEEWADHYFLPELEREARALHVYHEDGTITTNPDRSVKWPCVEITVLAHGAGTQTSVLVALSQQNPLAPDLEPGDEGYLHVDVATFANVADLANQAMPNEWPETLRYMVELDYLTYVPIVVIEPFVWNPTLERQYDGRGLFGRFYARSTMPYRQFRGCTDMFKIVPQETFLRYLIDEAAKIGVDLRIRQILGYSADEAHRAARFEPSHPNIRPYFPLIEWGWKRGETIDKLRQLCPLLVDAIGVPEKSGCHFCPFQPVGRTQGDGSPQPRSWFALRQEHPFLFWMGAAMEWRQIARRLEEGKSVQYLSGAKRPVSEIRTGLPVFTDPLLETGYDDAPGDSVCSSWGCFR